MKKEDTIEIAVDEGLPKWIEIMEEIESHQISGNYGSRTPKLIDVDYLSFEDIEELDV